MANLVRAALARVFVLHGNALGIDTQAELDKLGLVRELFLNDDALIPLTQVIQLLENAAKSAKLPDLGLRLVQYQDFSILGALAVMMRHATTIREAMHLASAYSFVNSDAIQFFVQSSFDQPGHVHLGLEIVVSKRPACSQTIELAMGTMAKFLTLMHKPAINIAALNFPHRRVGPSSSYNDVLKCECAFEAQFASLVIPEAALDLPLKRGDSLLRDMAREYIDARHPSPSKSTANRVMELLRRDIGIRQLTLQSISDQLHCKSRTLQRRLLYEGFNFEDLLDQVRRDRCIELLSGEGRMGLTEIAHMIGYADQSILTRSCWRWFGCSPTSFMKNRTNMV